MHTRAATLLGCLLVLGVTGWGCKNGPAARAGAKPKAALEGLDEQGRMQVGEQDRCPVCAMKVAKHPKFNCAIELQDGTTYYFCATGCLIRSWLHPEVYLNASKVKLKRAVVREYFTGQQISALAATWVAGSDVVGPMGPALVPLQDDAAAGAFMKRHGGKTTFKLHEMTDARWQAITGKKP